MTTITDEDISRAEAEGWAAYLAGYDTLAAPYPPRTIAGETFNSNLTHYPDWIKKREAWARGYEAARRFCS